MKIESLKIRNHLILFAIAVLICLTGCSDENLVSSKERMTLQEKVRLRIIKHDSGHSYQAKALFPWGDDIDWSLDNQHLLENGKPISQKTTKASEVIESGKGRFSHLDGDKLFISSSDGSNPLENEKSYELSYNKEVYKNRVVYQTSKEYSKFSIDLPDSSVVRPYRLIIKNLDNKSSATVKILKKGLPDFSSTPSILKSILLPKMTDEEKAIAIWKFIVDWRYHYTPSSERNTPSSERNNEPHDPVKLINVYGYGFCDDAANAYSFLASEAGYGWRINWLRGHVVPEIYYDDSWHMLDPDINVYYRDKDGRIASVKYIADHPELIINGPNIGDKKYRKLVANIYSTKENNRTSSGPPFASAYTESPPHKIEPVFFPGDEAIFNFLNNKRASRDKEARKQPIPYILGNGKITRHIKLSSLEKRNDYFYISNSWPYVLLGGKVELILKQPNSQHNIYLYSEAAKRGFPLRVERAKDKIHVDLTSILKKLKTAQYGTSIMVSAGGYEKATEIFKSIKLEEEFQFAPRTLAQISPGKNTFEVFIDFSRKEKSKESKGVEITLEWLESVSL